MKTEIKSKVQKLIESYNEVKKDITEKINAWKTDVIYSLDYREEKIKELEDQALQLDDLFNKKIKELIVKERESIIGEPEKTPADYQIQISNALKFLELAGEKLTDDQAYNILKPFVTDFETMALFKPVVEGLSKKGGLDIWNQFNKTFGKTEKFIVILNNFRVAEETADGLFNFKDLSLAGSIRSKMFMDAIGDIEKLVTGFDVA
jgi:hypothetical protein